MGSKNAIKIINIQKFYSAHFGPIPSTLVHQLFYNLLQWQTWYEYIIAITWYQLFYNLLQWKI